MDKHDDPFRDEELRILAGNVPHSIWDNKEYFIQLALRHNEELIAAGR